MDRKEVDACGLTCPHPALETDKALRELGKGTVVTIVDNTAARDNVKRLAEGAGCTVSIEKKEVCYEALFGRTHDRRGIHFFLW